MAPDSARSHSPADLWLIVRELVRGMFGLLDGVGLWAGFYVGVRAG